jgi:putative oxygen-independent coproporphyrinogen III oxidase
VINKTDDSIPLSLYIHFPWCVKKCPYCDFNSHPLKNNPAEPSFPEQNYINALLNDLAAELAFVQGRKIHSIFFGGGTPSLLSGASVDKILSTAEKLIGFETNIEITLEANPGTAEQARFRDYRSAGVNRISLGAQSFSNQQLKNLGRIHAAEETFSAVDKLRLAGFENFNLDLMFALPGQQESSQTLDEAMDDLQQAINLSPPHLSWYQLTLEPNTVFYSERPALPDDDLQFDIMQAGHQLLAQHGYAQYETSAFSKKNRQCQHNRNYWEFGDYLGIGAGAHGKITIPGNNVTEKNPYIVRRRQKTRMPEHYLQSINPCSADHVLAGKDLIGEFALNALRLIDGVPRHLFTERTGLPFSAIEKTTHQLIKEGLLVDDVTRFAPTPKGALFLNDVVARFITI